MIFSFTPKSLHTCLTKSNRGLFTRHRIGSISGASLVCNTLPSSIAPTIPSGLIHDRAAFANSVDPWGENQEVYKLYCTQLPNQAILIILQAC